MPGRYRGSSNDDDSFVYDFELFENNVNFVDGKFPGAIVNFELGLLVDRNPVKIITIGRSPSVENITVSDSPITLDLIPNFIPETEENPAQIEYTFADIEGQQILQAAFDAANEFNDFDFINYSEITLIVRDRSDDPGFQFGSDLFSDDNLSTITFEQASSSAISDINFIVDNDLLGAFTNYSLDSDNTFALGQIITEDTELLPEPGEGITVIRVQAEDYSSYVDTTPGNTGGAYRNDDVDIEVTEDIGGGFNVGWIAEGESLTYNLDIPKTGLYQVVARVASDINDRLHRLDVSVNGQNTSLNFNGTGDWQSWINVTGDTLNLNSGSQELRLNMGSSKFNINYIDLIPLEGIHIEDVDSNLITDDSSNSTDNFLPLRTNYELDTLPLDGTPIFRNTFLEAGLFENDVYKFELSQTRDLDIFLDIFELEDDASLELYRDSNNNDQLDFSDEFLGFSNAVGSDDISYFGAFADTYFAVVSYVDSGSDSLINYDISIFTF